MSPTSQTGRLRALARAESELEAAPDPRTPEQLVEAARRGERVARRALVLRYAPAVNNLAYHLLGRDDDVEDLIQDCFVEVLASLRSLKDARAFEAWLRLIVVRAAARLIRRRRIRRRLGLDKDQLATLEGASLAIRTRDAPPEIVLELRQIYRVLDSLPTDLRVALVLQRVEGLPLDEVARLTGTSLATVKRRVARAEAALDDTGHLAKDRRA